MTPIPLPDVGAVTAGPARLRPAMDRAPPRAAPRFVDLANALATQGFRMWAP